MEKKGKENETEERRSQAGEQEAFPVTLLYEVDRLLQTFTLAYILLRAREVTKATKIIRYYKG